MKRLNVFVAGHTGLVGSALLRNNKNANCFVASRQELDLENRKQVEKFLENREIDTVILAAAKVGGIGANSKFQARFLVENLDVQNSVISAAQSVGVRNLIFLGSSCIYPKHAPQPISESALLAGPLEATNEGYAIAKIAGVKLCSYLGFEYDLNYFSIMPTNLYGPNDNFDIEFSHVPAALMRRFHEAKIRQEPQVAVWGSGKPKREFMHVDDLASAIWHLSQMNLGGQLINIGTGEEISIENFANLMASVVGYQGEIIFDTSKPDGTPRKLLNVSKVESLGWRYSIKLEEGLKSTYDWFIKARDRGEVRGYK